MKTDYAQLGRKALVRLRSTAKRTEAVQTKLLADLLNQNCHTAYGRKYEFEKIRTAKEFQEKVPVSAYEDYEPYIQQIIEGREQVLTEEKAVYFCISSGTTGEPKYLPLMEPDLDIQYLYTYAAIFGTVREFYADQPEEEVFGKIFQIGEFARTCMEDGRMNGIRSGALYQWLDRDGQFDASDYCVPKEVLFPDKVEDITYVKVRFALAEREIGAIHGVFVNRIVGVMHYIYQNWDMLLRDMERGTVDDSVELAGEWKQFVREKLPPDPVRAAELRSLPYQELSHDMIKKIWPGIKYILAIGGSTFSIYMDEMKEKAGDIPIHYFAYAASEGIFGVAEKMNEPDAYVLIPDAGFFEFLPFSEDESGSLQQTPYLMWEVSCGRKYELLFTNHSGLYRYCIGDVVEVVGWYEKAPVVRFSHRKNQTINIAGEKSSLGQIEDAVSRFSRIEKLQIKGYCVQEEISEGQPRYLFYIECKDRMPSDAEKTLDDCLCSVNYEYKGCRSINEIGMPRILLLQRGCFERYEKYRAAQGEFIGQHKPPRILDSEEKKRFFALEKQRGN